MKPTHLYLAQSGDLFKIGISCRAERRMLELDPPNYVRPVLLQTWHRPTDAREIERYSLALLKEFIVWQREWVRAPRDEVTKAITYVIKCFDNAIAVAKRRALAET